MKYISKQQIVSWLAGLAVLAFMTTSHAAVVCNVTSPGLATGYVPANVTTNITSSTFSVTCSRDNSPGGATVTVQYQIAADSGLNPLGTQNRAVLGANFLNYHLATDPACVTLWDGVNLLPTPIASFTLAKGASVTNTYTYYGCILPGQAVLPPEGIYTDTVTMSFLNTKPAAQATFTAGSFPVNITAPATCNLTTPPSNVAFAYTAFSPADVLANSSFGVTCTASLQYTMTLDATIGVAAGLNYSLALNTTATGGVNPLTSVGTGAVQSFFINGTMVAGQAGACTTASCLGTEIRMLTVTY